MKVNRFFQRGRGGFKMAYLASILLEPEEEAYLVFASKKEGYKDNVILKGRIRTINITKDLIQYHIRIYKCVNNKNITKEIEQGKWKVDYYFSNANINTGYRNGIMGMPVFTTKEKCLEWLNK